MNDTSVVPGTRTWGDGLDAFSREHVIARISYESDMSWITCSCGEPFEAPTPELLSAKWLAHGGKVLITPFADRVPEPNDDLDSRFEMIYALRAQQAKCTCATNDIRDCPNYQPGDEEVDVETETD